MVFNSLTFLLFFIVVLLLHNLPLSWHTKKVNLVVASYLFYAAWNPPFVALLWLTTLVDWLVAQRMVRTEHLARKRLLLLVSLAGNLGLLAYFKYGTFLLENFGAALASIGVEYRPPAPDIILPIGISFYTFVTLSYTIDVYRGEIKPARSLLDFCLLVTFFPHLVAGPILRSSFFLPQCLENRKATPQQLGWGSALLVLGLFEKVVLADGIVAPVADTVFGGVSRAGFWDAWIGTMAFSGQIFFDFDGYSLCAIGAAMCLGFTFPDNFRFPYAAIGFSDFWRRWHISLSTWLRDYLYVSLGGNRRGATRTYVNLMLTMLIGGLWHGASWRFVVWGGLHGLYLTGERLLRAREIAGAASLGLRPLGRRGSGLVLALLTYLMVCLAWVFFRANDLPSALTLVGTMFSVSARGGLLGPREMFSVMAVVIAMLTFHWLLKDSSLEAAASRMPWWLRSLVLAGLLLAITLAPGDDRAFIYFQF